MIGILIMIKPFNSKNGHLNQKLTNIGVCEVVFSNKKL